MNRSSPRVERFSPAAALLVLAVSILALLPAFGQAPGLSIVPASQEMPPLEELGRRLFEAVNQERVSRSLPALRVNPALEALARAHSEDMAGRGHLGHLSAAGDTLTDRLRKAGLFFAANAENVARSDSFDPELIHRAFMDSPEHRKNVLDRDLNEAGMAVVRGQAGAFFITQDFIKSLPLLDEPEIRDLVLTALAEAARRRGVPPLRAIEKVDATARAFARDQAEGRSLPEIPTAYGEASVRFFAGGDLDGLLDSVRSLDTRPFQLAGVGSWFGRSPERPGGSYVVCAFFLSGGPALDMGVAEWRQAVLDALNRIRISRGRSAVELDARLSRKADAFNRRFQKGQAIPPPQKGSFSALFYETQDLGRVPGEIRDRIADTALSRAGISVLPVPPENGFSVRFSVAILFAN